MDPRRADDLTRFRRVPDLPALATLRPARPSLRASLRDQWTPRRTLVFAVLSPVAFWVYAGLTRGLATSQPAWGALVALMALGAAFVVSSYAGRPTASGACGVAPLAWLALAGWLLVENPTLVGAGFGVAMVGVAALQRVTRPAC